MSAAVPALAERGRPTLLFVTSSLAVGGTERHLVSISSALRARGWSITVFSTGGDGPLASDLREAGVSVVVPGASALADRRLFRLPIAAARLVGLLVGRRDVIVHCFLPEAYVVAAPLAVLLRTRLAIMSRRSLNVYQNGYGPAAWAERRLHPMMSAVLANSRSVAKELLMEGVAPERIGLIYNGVVDAPGPPADRRQTRAGLGIEDSALVLVIVANLIPYKGHLDLVDALGAIAGKMPAGWRLLIVGRDEGVGADIRARAEALGIADHIGMLGQRADVADLLNAGDVGLLASHQEGFSNAILEGMRAGLPMIVTDVGGNAEAVIDGETGIVVPPHNPEAFAGAILRLASDPALRRSFGDAGRRRVARHFSLSACVDAYEAMYAGLLAGKRPADIAEIRLT